MASTFQNPKGTRDFLPEEMAQRQYIFETIEKVYQKYGFARIETPAFERLSTLMGKYGDEGDKLMFKVLNSGNYLKGSPQNLDTAFYQESSEGLDKAQKKTLSRLTEHIADKALRYDLTVPFARFVVQHKEKLQFPFKRYQIQAVWRADRPQKGRYQEFYQCDADVVGSVSLVHEVDFVQIFDEVLSNLGIPQLNICINNRKILAGLADYLGLSDNFTEFVNILDGLDKIGKDQVIEKLQALGANNPNLLHEILSLSDKHEEKINFLAKIAHPEIEKGVAELSFIFEHTKKLGLNKGNLVFDLTLARGLNYYTGCIFEVKTTAFEIGSLCGGGRYDDLTAVFGQKGLTGVGISFGADRIYDVLQGLHLFPEKLAQNLDFLMLPLDEVAVSECLLILHKWRKQNHGLNMDMYPLTEKLKKQMQYANDRKCAFVLLRGETERAENIFMLKNMQTGEQIKLQEAEILPYLTKIR
jgi:histidyl-tRNA synthetase